MQFVNEHCQKLKINFPIEIDRVFQSRTNTWYLEYVFSNENFSAQASTIKQAKQYIFTAIQQSILHVHEAGVTSPPSSPQSTDGNR